MADDYTDQLREGLEGALTILGMTADVAQESGSRTLHVSILALMRQCEDLRARVEDFDPELLDPVFPQMVRANGVPRATRIAIAQDQSCAIYKRIDAGGRTPYFFVYPFEPGSTVRRVRAAEPMYLKYLPDPHKYAWDVPEELTATQPERLRHIAP